MSSPPPYPFYLKIIIEQVRKIPRPCSRRRYCTAVDEKNPTCRLGFAEDFSTGGKLPYCFRDHRDSPKSPLDTIDP